jgi:hypothetical protein
LPDGSAPVAIRVGTVHFESFSREIQIPTSGAPSRVPAKKADSSVPSPVSAIVDAWQDGKGADSKMNSLKLTDGVCCAGAAMSMEHDKDARMATKLLN